MTKAFRESYMGNWHFVPMLGASVVTATVTVFVTATAMGIGVTVLLETSWVFVVAVVGALAIYRLMLSRYDHRAQLGGIGSMSPVHIWFMHREARVDHVAIPLTFGALVYTVLVGLFLVGQLVDSAIRKFVTLFTFR